MNRRKFIAKTPVIAPLIEDEERPGKHRVVDNPFANKALPHVARTSTGLEPYAGTWGYDQVAHLLRRTMLGAKKSDVVSMMSHTLDEVIDILLTDISEPSLPLSTSSADPDAPVGTTWVNAASNTSNTARDNSLKSWWLGLMLNQQVSIR